MRAGAYDFVTKPIEMELLAVILRRAVERRQLQEQIRSLSEAVERTARFEELLGESPAMQKLYDQLAQIADSEASVLITGESGTGKELVARALHQRSRRRDKPFVAVNCAALPDTLLESELFGHVKGAFTDARSDRKGLFVQAEGGTLLLDEIGEMPLAMQPKLLRALEENKVRPVGSEKEVAFDVRILAATNRDLETAVEERRFREDLFFRINVIQVELPPLRARGTDALLLAQHFIAPVRRAGQETGASACPKPVAEKLLAYSLAGQRPRAAQRDRAGRGPDAIRQAHGRRPAGENPRLPQLASGHRRQRSGRAGAAGGGGAPLHPARAGMRGRKSHPGRPHAGARPEDALPQTPAIWRVGRRGGVSSKVPFDREQRRLPRVDPQPHPTVAVVVIDDRVGQHHPGDLHLDVEHPPVDMDHGLRQRGIVGGRQDSAPVRRLRIHIRTGAPTFISAVMPTTSCLIATSFIVHPLASTFPTVPSLKRLPATA